MDRAALEGRDVKLNARKLEEVKTRLERAVEERQIPGAAIAVGVGQETVFRHAAGFAQDWEHVRRPASLDTIYDLASLTKVVATLPAVLSLVDDGRVRLRDPVGLFIPAYACQEKESVTLWHLLTHTAGLIAHRPFHQLCEHAKDVWRAVEEDPLVRPPGTAVVYSDLGFMLLGRVVEAETGLPLDVYARQRVFAPLGMRDTGFCPAPAMHGRIAATEVSPQTGQPKLGVVHDENAEAVGGVSGHAGLFAPLADLELYVKMWLAQGWAVLSPAVRRVAVECQTAHLDGRRGLGWVSRGDGYDHTGDLWPATTVGHTGFTGTSLAFDPASGLWTVLLTNRVHYGRENNHIIRLRQLVHNIIGAAAE